MELGNIIIGIRYTDCFNHISFTLLQGIHNSNESRANMVIEMQYSGSLWQRVDWAVLSAVMGCPGLYYWS